MSQTELMVATFGILLYVVSVYMDAISSQQGGGSISGSITPNHKK
jgi:hypothetical protein